MSTPQPDFDTGSRARLAARLSILAAFLSCTLNCVFSQVAARAGQWLGDYSGVVSWFSLLVVLAGATLGAAGLVGGWRRKSADTQVIAGLGLVLNAGIVFVVIWYFTFVRPAAQP
jgi:hypothetical protein